MGSSGQTTRQPSWCTRGQAAYPTALAWLGVLLAALTLAGLAAYWVYNAFAGVYGE